MSLDTCRSEAVMKLKWSNNYGHRQNGNSGFTKWTVISYSLELYAPRSSGGVYSHQAGGVRRLLRGVDVGGEQWVATVGFGTEKSTTMNFRLLKDAKAWVFTCVRMSS